MQEDGSYYEVTITENTNYTRASTKSGTKTERYVNSSGSTDWQVSVTGVFSYSGSSSICTSASVNAKAFNSFWSIYSKSASKSGNTASASATAKKNTGIKSSRGVTLTCSPTGRLS
ncbi:hypothetical protein ACWG0P_04000 [Amedibacillus sp. YH-ame6]